MKERKMMSAPLESLLTSTRNGKYQKGRTDLKAGRDSQRRKMNLKV
jgi:hypothetical protein